MIRKKLALFLLRAIGKEPAFVPVEKYSSWGHHRSDYKYQYDYTKTWGQ